MLRSDPAADGGEGGGEGAVRIEGGGVDQDGVGGAAEGADGAVLVLRVALGDLGGDGGAVDVDAAPRSSRKRRSARAAGEAVTKSFTGASGKMTVPMSRPSMTAPREPGKRRWKCEQGGADAGLGGDQARGAIDLGRAEVGAVLGR